MLSHCGDSIVNCSTAWLSLILIGVDSINKLSEPTTVDSLEVDGFHPPPAKSDDLSRKGTSRLLVKRAQEIIEDACNNEEKIEQIINKYDGTTYQSVDFEEAAYRVASIYFTKFEEAIVKETYKNQFTVRL